MDFLYGSGGRTRTSDLRVMSPTSCQLLYPAMYRYMGIDPIFLSNVVQRYEKKTTRANIPMLFLWWLGLTA